MGSERTEMHIFILFIVIVKYMQQEKVIFFYENVTVNRNVECHLEFICCHCYIIF